MRTWINIRGALLAGTALATFGAGAHAQAQDNAGAAVEEIVVTALRRDQTLQEAPLSISAVTGEILAAQGASNMNDYFRQIPSLNVSQGSPNNQRVSLRGVQSAGEATTGVYYDETPVTGPAGSSADAGSRQPDLNVYDVERVEVLRGPQGTLYGAGSMGGTLRVIFNKPNVDRMEASGEAQVGSIKGGDISYGARGMVNVPIIDGKLALRVVGFTETRGGYIDNVRYDRDDINGSKSQGIRAMLGLQATETLRVNALVMHQTVSFDDSVTYWSADLGKYKTDAWTVGIYDNEFELFNVTGSWELPFATLTATSSKYSWKILDVNDYTQTLMSGVTSASSCRAYHQITTGCTPQQTTAYQAYANSRIPGNFYQPSTLDNWTNEVRLSSNSEGRLDWTIGAFNEDRIDHLDSLVYRTDPRGYAMQIHGDETGYRWIETKQKQTAFFGELSFRPIEGLTLTAGARRYNYEKEVSGQVVVANILTGSSLSPFEVRSVDAKGWVTKLNASYEVTPDLMVYATRSEGFRPGGANNTANIPNTLLPYEPDKLTNYEAGVKSAWFENRLTANLSVFQIDWEDMQINATSTNGAFRFITNAGAARIKGSEFELVAQPVEGLNLNAGIGYTDARLREDQASPAIIISGSSGLKGDRIPFVPRYNAALGASYTWPVFGDYEGLVRLDYTYTGPTASEFRPTFRNYEKQDAYGLLNARVGVQRDTFGAYLFVQNLGGDQVIRTSTGTGFTDRLVSATPRTIGVNIRASY